MKIAKKDLERLVLEELEASLDEGIFSQVGAGLKGAASQIRGAAKDVGGAVKQAAGKVAGAYQTGKAAQKEKEKASSSQQAILRIAAEILANPQASGVSEQNTQGLWKVIKHYAENPPSGTRSRFSPAALVREEDNIEEATEREIRTELSLLQKAIKDGIVNIEDIEQDVRRLVRTNPVARAIPGASKLEPKVLQPEEEPVAVQPVQQPVQQPAAAPQASQAQQPEAAPTTPAAIRQPTEAELPQGETIQVPRTSGGTTPGVLVSSENLSQVLELFSSNVKLKNAIKTHVEKGEKVAVFKDGDELAAKLIKSGTQPTVGQSASQPAEPSIPDTSRTSPTPESEPEKEQKAREAADNIMRQIATAINSARVSKRAKKEVKASTEKARQAVAREIRAGLQEQKDRWQELAGILKD